MNFDKMLREIRMEKHITQQTIADAVGVALRSYQQYEQGIREPSYATLIALADFLDVTTDRLLGRGE